MDLSYLDNELKRTGVLTSGDHISLWTSSVEPLKFSKLQSELSTEVVVVGAGIAGLTTAYSLVKAGRKVIVFEDGYIGSGETGRTTAHIVNALDDFYAELSKLHGEENSRLMAESHTEAINLIEKIVNEENIDCDFSRIDGYLFLHPSDKLKTLQDELKVTRKVGIPTVLVESVPGMINQEGPALKYPDQAQFHPLKYLHGLAKAVIKYGGQIFTETHVTDIKEHEMMANGFKVKAEHVVVATNSPVNNMVTMHTKQFAYRTYVIAAKIPKGLVAPALWWDTGDHNSKYVTMPYNYVRVYEYNEEFDLLIHGGLDHKTGQADATEMEPEQRYSVLEDWLKIRFPFLQEILFKWSGQVLEPVDAVAFIGRNPGDKTLYISTGDSGNGITHGTIAGMLIPDLINNKPNPWEKIYDPSRINLKSTGDFLKEVGNMVVQYADFLKAGDLSSAKDVPVNQGAVITIGIKKIAVFKDEAGRLNAYTAICPHLGCVLEWNGDEKSFDCPCHGSRFTCEGKVINGPAVSDLEKVEIKQD
jgi:glycine/D-amino acid oxidase-like deaminating enzyme/nitrite reductase/ring-hydroxylating ferredoxin subunit